MFGITPFNYLPKSIRVLLIINAAMFLMQFVAAAIQFAPLITLFNNLALRSYSAIPNVWTVFTYMFIHGSVMHLVFNMLALWMIGDVVNRELGEKRFLLFYLVTGTVAGIITAVFYNIFFIPNPVVGASGAIVAIFYLFARKNPNATMLLFMVIPMRVQTMLYILIGWDILGALGLINDGIGHVTHLGGLLCAVAYEKLLKGSSNSAGMNFQGSGESSFSNIAEKVKQKFSGDTSKKDYDIHSPHETNDTLDSILKKVSDYGVNALSEKEKLFLEKVSEQRRLQKGDNIRNLDDYK